MNQFRTFSDAFIVEIKDLINKGTPAEAITDPDSPASEFGFRPRVSLERIGQTFSTICLSDNIVTCKQIPFNLTYGIGLFLWSIAGSDDVDSISYYRGTRARGKKVSFGQRMLRAEGKHDLLQLALVRIARDPGTRRAYLPIFSVSDLFECGEIPCAVGFHLHQRKGALHAVTIMRAQNAITAWPMDYFLFSSFLRFAAARANLEEGTYTQFSSTFHAFTDDLEQVKDDIRAGALRMGEHGLGSMRHLPKEIPALLEFEAGLRLAVADNMSLNVQNMSARDQEFESEAGATIARVLISIALKRLGASHWAHPRLEPRLSALIR